MKLYSEMCADKGEEDSRMVAQVSSGQHLLGLVDGKFGQEQEEVD